MFFSFFFEKIFLLFEMYKNAGKMNKYTKT